MVQNNSGPGQKKPQVSKRGGKEKPVKKCPKEVLPIRAPTGKVQQNLAKACDEVVKVGDPGADGVIR